MIKYDLNEQIPDLWHIAMAIKDNVEREEILKTWYLAHSYQRQLQNFKKIVLEQFDKADKNWIKREDRSISFPEFIREALENIDDD